MSAPRLYSATEVDQIPWPATPDGDYARRYLSPLMREGTRTFIENVQTDLYVLILDDLALPVTVNDAQYDNCYVAGQYNHYVVYAKEELKTLDEPVSEALLDVTLSGLGVALRAGEINKAVTVNNWLLSTNLYPNLSVAQLAAITKLLIDRFPDHALVFRSINTVQGPELLDSFRALGFIEIASRQLYYIWPVKPDHYDPVMRKLAKKDLKRDNKLLETGDYELISLADIKETDLPRVLDLYNYLYLDKYSKHNPRFTRRFVELAYHERTLELRVLRHRDTGRIDGALGFFMRNGAMTAPLVGYDIHLPQGAGLYRMLMMVSYTEALERGLLLNQSSGAGNFKRARGGRPNIEYSVVYERHLWPHRRLTWQSLAALINGIAVPLMKNYKL
jgi:hypothetical protein